MTTAAAHATDRRRRALVLGALVVAALLLAWAWQRGLGERLSLDGLKASRDALAGAWQARPLATAAAFFALYVAAAGLSFPGAAVLTLAAGAIFGFAAGLVIVSFASALGALLAFLAARTLLRGFVQQRFGRRLAAVDDGVRRDGALYLLSLRLVPLVPFWLVNLLMGLTAIGAARFYVVSQLGMLPGTAVYVNAGTQLASLRSAGDVFSPALLASFALLGVFPLLAKGALGWWQQRRALARWWRPTSPRR